MSIRGLLMTCGIIAASMVGCDVQRSNLPGKQSETDEPPGPITIEFLRKGKIKGQLGYPIGERVKIEGTRIKDPYPSSPRKRPPYWNACVYLKVTKVSGDLLPVPVCVSMTGAWWLEFGYFPREIGRTFTFEGLETLQVYVDGSESEGQEVQIFSGFDIRGMAPTPPDARQYPIQV